VGLLAAGCGRTAQIGASRTLQVALSEYRINPSAISVSRGFVTLVVRNYGRLTHNLVVSENGRPDGATRSIPPGREATLIVDLAPGRYTMSSTILSDADLGARGTLTVS
jgi:hypothetical protein